MINALPIEPSYWVILAILSVEPGVFEYVLTKCKLAIFILQAECKAEKNKLYLKL